MSGYSILVVDDEPDNFDVIEALLPNESYTLHYANCGEDAIAYLDKFDPDLILLDVMMPGINGIEVCRRIKLMSQWQGVPIIMVTALSGKEDLARCLAAGADDFLHKPVNGLELRARVNSMLRIKKQHDRIQSFSKLQRNNIHSLANNLNEIRLDLAVGFPAEFNAPLNIISDNIKHLTARIETINPATLKILESSDLAVRQLRHLTEKFWFYLQLTLETSETNRHEISIPKPIFNQSLATKFAGLFMTGVVCEIEDVRLAVKPEHFQWIVTELIECVSVDAHVKIHGEVMDNAFHISLSIQANKAANPLDLDLEMSRLIEFNSSDSEDKELEIGLKIVKKIVEIYDGIFLMSGSVGESSTFYLTLPLAADSLSAIDTYSAVPTFKRI
ncbi:response regulator [Chamaesiphon sp. GL140_3_metabinner_50]|uniref:ATP-binding response regulator n=1 Tax=Chamaesiphon sp. GL140_3_metabinner_50 TaxID=2970812 RepID=UPI0025DD5097|nr:response regulator [Chamaesiphon sp. GL140_3_metabinner_50]